MVTSLKNIKFWDSTLIGVVIAALNLIVSGLTTEGFKIFQSEAFYVSLLIAGLGIFARGLKPAEPVKVEDPVHPTPEG